MKLGPVNIHENCWYYEDDNGIGVYIRRDGVTVTETIPWVDLRESLARKDKRILPRRRREAV